LKLGVVKPAIEKRCPGEIAISERAVPKVAIVQLRRAKMTVREGAMAKDPLIEIGFEKSAA
jgi:hypothetical protein